MTCFLFFEIKSILISYFIKYIFQIEKNISFGKRNDLFAVESTLFVCCLTKNKNLSATKKV